MNTEGACGQGRKPIQTQPLVMTLGLLVSWLKEAAMPASDFWIAETLSQVTFLRLNFSSVKWVSNPIS